MGGSLTLSRYADLTPAFNAAMLAADITTVNRAAMFCAQLGHESAGLRYMAEIQTSGPGWSWDRTQYRGRGPIQLTWQANYRKFGEWCKAKGYVTDSELFVNQPELVEQPRWGFLAASWYWLHGGPRPGRINAFADAGDILAVSRCVNGWIEGREPNGMPDRRDRWNRCLALGSALLSDYREPTQEVPAMTSPIARELNEIGRQPNPSSPRGGAPVLWFLLHTQEGGNPADGARALANYLQNTANQVSYHYVVDNSGTVIDVVDTDRASWSVLSANPRSINFCFAGSRASWTRQQWFYNMRRGIDCAAWIAVQDGRKYEIPARSISPADLGRGVKGVADHNAITVGLGVGNHTDVGKNFPWDYLNQKMTEYSSPATKPPAQEDDMAFTDEDRRKLDYIYEQLGPGVDQWGEDGDLGRNKAGQRRTLRAGLAALLRGGK